MKKIYYLAGLTIITLSFGWYAPAQKVPEPLSESASLEDTGKWLIKALKKSFIFPTNDKAGNYRIDDLSFTDCLLTFNVVREGPAPGSSRIGGVVDDGNTPSNGNKNIQVRIGTKVSDPLDPNTREPRVEPGTDPNHFPVPQSAPRAPKSNRKVLDTQMFDLYQIDPASFQIMKMPQAPGILYLLMVNRSLTAKASEGIQPPAAPASETKPDFAPPSQVISQKPGGMIPLSENSVAPIRAGFAHAIKLCQAPK
jgi:hypothetical protein